MQTDKHATELMKELAGSLTELLGTIVQKRTDQTNWVKRGIVRRPLHSSEERAAEMEEEILDRCHAALRRFKLEGPL